MCLFLQLNIDLRILYSVIFDGENIDTFGAMIFTFYFESFQWYSYR